MEDQLNDLQREWRAIVLSKLNSLEAGQSKLASDIVEIKTSFVQQSQYQQKINSLEKKISELEKFKYKVIAWVAALQIIIGFILWLLNYLKV